MDRRPEIDDLAHTIALRTSEYEVCSICRHMQEGWFRLPDADAPEIEQLDRDVKRYLELRGAIEYDELRRSVRLVEPKA
jgi:hypothetical protein